jgi:large subunit ribosomal protein L18
MAKMNPKRSGRMRRKRHIRKTLQGTADRPRLSIFRSVRHIYAQVIDDVSGTTLASASSLTIESAGGNRDGAALVGKAVAAAANAQDIKKVVFDRNGYLYHGRVAALADAAREAGLEF